jgi:small subunit ribosomal protein S6
MLYSYETTVILKPNATEDQATALKTKVEGIIAAHEGQVANYEDWGTRKMTYSIQGESRGRYVYFAFSGNNAAIAEIERNLRINENVMRYLSLNLSREVDMEALKQPSAMKRPPRRDDAQAYE